MKVKGEIFSPILLKCLIMSFLKFSNISTTDPARNI